MGNNQLKNAKRRRGTITKQENVYRVIWTNPTIEDLSNNKALLEEFIRELQEYLKDNEDRWFCRNYDERNDGWDNFNITQEFCEKRKVDYEEMKELIDGYGGEMFTCECQIVNQVEV